jgi:hypothetical protein
MGQRKRLGLQLSQTENLKREDMNRANLIIAYHNLIEAGFHWRKLPARDKKVSLLKPLRHPFPPQLAVSRHEAYQGQPREEHGIGLRFRNNAHPYRDDLSIVIDTRGLR